MSLGTVPRDTHTFIFGARPSSYALTQIELHPHHPVCSPSLQIKMLSDRKRELEHRLSATLEENDLLQGTVEELQDRVLILERQGHDKDLQVQGRDAVP